MTALRGERADAAVRAPAGHHTSRRAASAGPPEARARGRPEPPPSPQPSLRRSCTTQIPTPRPPSPRRSATLLSDRPRTVMKPDTSLDLVTGAFSYSGAHIARRLLASGRQVRTLTFHPDRPHPLRDRVQAFRYRFEDPLALSAALEGVTTLYNTYWVRFDHGPATYPDAVANSRALFDAARRAGVARIVHVSIANPSVDSSLPYYRGKAQVERALSEVGV